MAKALCISCGHEKSAPWKTCRHCGYDVKEDEDSLVKSVYLSVNRFQDANQKKDYAVQLDRIGQKIALGKHFDFDESELRRLRRQYQSVKNIPLSAVWLSVFRLFLPWFVIMLILSSLIFLLRVFR